MNDKFIWKTPLSIILLVLVILTMIFLTAKGITNLENDKDVWFHKDIKWRTCSCSTEVPEYINMCKEFIISCENDFIEKEEGE